MSRQRIDIDGETGGLLRGLSLQEADDIVSWNGVHRRCCKTKYVKRIVQSHQVFYGCCRVISLSTEVTSKLALGVQQPMKYAMAYTNQ